jgi:hypothetical protein
MSRKTSARLQLAQAIYQVLSRQEEPLELAQITEEVSKFVPLAAARPRQSVRNALTWRLSTVRYEDGRWRLVEQALQGYTARCTPHPPEIQAGVLFPAVRLSPFVPRFPDGGRRLTVTDRESAFTAAAPAEPGLHSPINLAPWYRQKRFRAGDSIIFKAMDLARGEFQMTYEPQEKKQAELVRQLNETFADIAHQAFTDMHQDQVFVESLVPRVLVEMPQIMFYPPDDYRDIFAHDRRFRLLETGALSGADFRRPSDYLFYFPKRGKGSFYALNPGYLVPLELDEEEKAMAQALTVHWIRLQAVEARSVDLEKKQVTVNATVDSSLGVFSSNVDLPLTYPLRMMRHLFAVLRRRFAGLLTAKIMTTPSAREIQRASIRDQEAVVPMLNAYLARFVTAGKLMAKGTLTEDEIEELKESRVTF